MKIGELRWHTCTNRALSPLIQESSSLGLAYETTLADGGWPVESAEDFVEDNIYAASQFPVGAVVGRRLDVLISRPYREWRL